VEPKPAHLAPRYGAQFGDDAVVAAYRHRPPYPAETFEIVDRLLAEHPRRVLEIGSGTGHLTRPFAGCVERIDAVEPAAAMRAAARALAGGDDAHIRWIAGSAETADLDPPYGLALAAESLHWTEWSVTLPRIGRALVPGAVLALVNRISESCPWDAELFDLIPRYSTNQEYTRYDLVAELTGRELFEEHGRETTPFAPFEQTVRAYVESFHSRNGFSRARMTEEAANAFDDALTALVARHATGGRVVQSVAATVVWGVVP
jgi:SAM-dependent methyltransferase